MDRNDERLPYVFLAVSNPSQDLPGVETESGDILSLFSAPRLLCATEQVAPSALPSRF